MKTGGVKLGAGHVSGIADNPRSPCLDAVIGAEIVVGRDIGRVHVGCLPVEIRV